MEITSPAFSDGETVPFEFTCEGSDVSPPLRWSGTPRGTSELRLRVEDPDAPGGTFVHWSVTGIDPTSTGVEQGEVPERGTEETNSAGRKAYVGPCPPQGDDPHRYVFAISAVDDAGTVIGSGRMTAPFGRA